MLAFAMLSWWYSAGWITLAKKIRNIIRGVYRSFSVPTLLRTLFQPWRQIVALPNPNQTVQQKLRGVLDNLVSRVVGLMVRIITLLTASVMMAVTAAAGVLVFAGWPFVPLLVLALLGKALGLL